MIFNLKFIGALCLLALFIGSGINKIKNFESTVNVLLKKSGFNMMPKVISQLAIVLAIVLLLAGSLYILYIIYVKDENKNKLSYNLTVIAVILFTILATFFFHNFFLDPSQKIHFMKNLAIIGGLILLIKT